MNHPLHWALAITLYWFLLGIGGSLFLRRVPQFASLGFLLGSAGSLALLFISGMGLTQTVSNFPVAFQWDHLSAFFVLLLSAASLGIGLFSSHYFRQIEARALCMLFFNYHFFLASMVWVFLAADALSFLIAWEFMAMSSYFLIVAFRPTPESNHAGFLYFLMAHVGAMAILVSFAVMLTGANDLSFAAMRVAHLTANQATLAFSLALIGFGAKAGLLPLHVWLPEAHPAAPSPVSALMSGVMLKTALYGMIRVFFDCLANQPFGSGLGMTLMIAGVLTALLGVILAAMQTDMKRLLAYSSIENIGIITVALGLALLFKAAHLPVLAALALSAALLHCFNHALFKSLLFLVTGSVLHATSERNLGKLGGLMAFMPWVAGMALIGVLSMAGVPPFNGFVSEWLLLQSFLFFPQISAPSVAMLLPVAAAAVALTIGLAAYVMVKFFGIIFLGNPRETELHHASDASSLERLGLGWLALSCVALGLFPVLLLRPITQLTTQLLGASPGTQSLWFVVPDHAARASYSPVLLFMLIAISLALIFCLVRLISRARTRRSLAWGCGHQWQTARMQDSAEGFGQPIKHIFSAFLQIELEVPTPFDKKPHYHIHATDRFWSGIYLPVLRLISATAKQISHLQQGKISIYLGYSFITLLVLLWWVQ